jgi:hypothetical protein
VHSSLITKANNIHVSIATYLKYNMGREVTVLMKYIYFPALSEATAICMP